MKTKVNPAVGVFNSCMWNGFAGCTRFDSDDRTKAQPVFREVESGGDVWLFVVDAVTVQASSEDGEVTWFLGVKFPTQEAAKAFLRGIEYDFTFLELGFKAM